MRQPPVKKGNATLYIVLLMAVLAFMFFLRQCSSQRHSASNAPGHSGGDTIDVAIDYSPVSLYTLGDTLGGFSYDLLRLIARDNGLNLKFHPVTSIERAVKLLDSGVYDIIVADIPATSDFKRRFLFTVPVFLDKSVLVQLRDSAGNLPVRSQLDLAGRRVTVVASSTVADRVRNLAREIGDSIYVDRDSVYSSEQLVMRVATGAVPLAVVNEAVARSVARDYSRLDVSTAISFTQFQAWMTTKGNVALRDSLNAMILRQADGDEYRALLGRYGLTR